MPEKMLEAILGEMLDARGLTISTAESCTGGLVGHLLTNIPGSSEYYIGSITAYAYHVKVRQLNVNWQTLESHGAVSRETVAEMASGVRAALETDIGIAVSGIAGPGGSSPGKPVGLVWLGLSTPAGDWTRDHNFEGDRIAVKDQAAEAALQFVYDYLDGKLDGSSD